MATYFSREIAPWMDATETLSDREYRVYDVVLNLIYLHEEPIRMNERGLAARSNMHINALRPAIQKLISLGKLHLSVDGKLSNAKASAVLKRIGKNPHKAPADSRRVSHESPAGVGPVSGESQACVEGVPPRLTRHVARKPLKSNGSDSLLTNIQTNELKPARAIKVFSEYDYLSSDEAVHFTAKEIDEAEADFPGLKDIRAAIRQTDRFFSALPIGDAPVPAKRKAIVIASLRKKNQEAVERQLISAAKVKADEAREDQKEERVRARKGRGMMP